MRTKMLIAAAFVATMVASNTAIAVEVLAPTGGVIDRNTIDASTGEVFMMWSANGDSHEFTVNGTVTQWSVYSDGTPARQGGEFITPLIFQHTGGDNYVLTGIGTARANTDTGLQTYAFDLVAGSAAVGSGYYFGWADGDQDGAGGTNTFNQGVAEFSRVSNPTTPGQGLDEVRRLGASSDVSAILGFSYNTNFFFSPSNEGTGRTYSISVTAVPEPASLALLGLGGLVMLRRRRRSR